MKLVKLTARLLIIVTLLTSLAACTPETEPYGTSDTTAAITPGESSGTEQTACPTDTAGNSDTAATGTEGGSTSAPTDTEPADTEPAQTTEKPDDGVPDAPEFERGKYVLMHDEGQYNSKAAVELTAGSYFAQWFSVNAWFDGISSWCPSWSNSIGNMTMSIYKYSSGMTPVAAMAQEPVVSQTFKDYQDCSWLDMTFDPIAPGDYLLVFSDPTEKVGIWLYPTDVTGSVFYDSGIEKEGEVCARIRILNDVDKLFNECTIQNNYGTVTTPPQPTLSDDDILVVRDAMPDTWVAVDGLGRVLPTNSEVGDLKDDKFVGMFYWTWHCSHSRSTVPINVQEIMDKYPGAINDINHSVWDNVPNGTPCFWNEPIYGYYTTTDKWVLRKQAEMLANAGVDVVIFDNTNGTYTWRESYMVLLEVFDQARKDGVKTPQVSFILPFWDKNYTATQLREIYLSFYRDGLYNDLWFYWDEKPLLMAIKASLDTSDPLEKEIYNFFTFRQGVPEYNASSATKTDKWGWLAVYPQAVYKDKKGLSMTTVGVAQNWNGQLCAMNDKNVFGRTYTSKGYDTRENAKLYGANFAEQWEYAIEKDVNFVFVTGWNEWVAGRHDEWQGLTNAFPDQCNDEFSRDIEPSTGELKDHYYYQLVSYIRQFKGAREVPAATAEKTVDIKGSISQWDSVGPYYIAYIGNTFDRDSVGYVGTHYTNTTGRNDIVGAKVARDSENLYFMVECNENITPYTDDNWMRLFIDVGDSSSSWEGFEYVLNKTSPSKTEAVLEKFKGSWDTETVGKVEYSLSGKYLTVKIPKALLGITSDSFTVNFKWNDNMQKDGDIMDFYVNGDTAPGGRFMYSYVVK